jgi:hypothetical protein
MSEAEAGQAPPLQGKGAIRCSLSRCWGEMRLIAAKVRFVGSGPASFGTPF